MQVERAREDEQMELYLTLVAVAALVAALAIAPFTRLTGG